MNNLMNATQPAAAVEALKTAHEKTTQGEWKAFPDGPHWVAICVDRGNVENAVIADVKSNDAEFIALAHNELPALLSQITDYESEAARLNRDFAALRIEHSQQADTVEALETKAALLDRVYACIESHTSEYHGVNIEFTTGEMRYGMSINDEDWQKFPLMNVLRDIWKAYNPKEEIKGE